MCAWTPFHGFPALHCGKKLSPKIALHFKVLCESKAMLTTFVNVFFLICQTVHRSKNAESAKKYNFWFTKLPIFPLYQLPYLWFHFYMNRAKFQFHSCFLDHFSTHIFPSYWRVLSSPFFLGLFIILALVSLSSSFFLREIDFQIFTKKNYW